MKLCINALAVCCLMMVIGCATTESSSVAPAAMSECGANCSGDTCAEMEGCCKGKAADECCKNKAKAEDASMGAMGEKSGCCSSKSQCTDKFADTSMGAVSDKPACSGSTSNCASQCPMTGGNK